MRSLICEGTVVQGHLRFVEGQRIDGEGPGDVSATGDGHRILMIGENARVHGKVKAAHVIIDGEVRGGVCAAEVLDLQPKARVVGELRYDLLEMHQGALVKGELKPLKMADKPALKLSASNDA